MKSLKLNQIEKTTLSNQELRQVKGGQSYSTYYCGCACAYADSGGSSTTDNGVANSRDNLSSGTSNDQQFITIAVYK